MYDISQLKKKLLPELQEISEKLKITNYKKLKKTDLIYEILDKQSIGKREEGIKERKQISEEKPKVLEKKRERFIKKPFKKNTKMTEESKSTYNYQKQTKRKEQRIKDKLPN